MCKIFALKIYHVNVLPFFGIPIIALLLHPLAITEMTHCLHCLNEVPGDLSATMEAMHE